MDTFTKNSSIYSATAPVGGSSSERAGIASPTPIAVTIAQACQMSGLSKATLYRAISAGRLPTRKFGARTLLIVEELRSFLTALPPGDAR